MTHNLRINAAFPTIGRIIRENCNIIHPTARQEIGAFKVYLLALVRSVLSISEI